MTTTEHGGADVLAVVFDGVVGLDLHGPLDVFEIAGRHLDRALSIQVVSRDGRPVRTSSGVQITPDGSLASAPRAPGTLLIPGGPGTRAAAADGELLRWLASVGPRSGRVLAVCTGALIAASAGLLEYRRATTHWYSAERLAVAHPTVAVDRGASFVRDGHIYTSAGVSSAIDVALTLVEADHGSELAAEIARILVLPSRRSARQPQIGIALSTPPAEDEKLRELQRWLPENLTEQLGVPELAGRAAMSVRNFSRLWKQTTGLPPATYVRRLRAERARALLASTPMSSASVAAICGFGSTDAMRRAIGTPADDVPTPSVSG